MPRDPRQMLAQTLSLIGDLIPRLRRIDDLLHFPPDMHAEHAINHRQPVRIDDHEAQMPDRAGPGIVVVRERMDLLATRQCDAELPQGILPHTFKIVIGLVNFVSLTSAHAVPLSAKMIF